MILVLNEPHEKGRFYFKFKHYLQACTTSGRKFLIFYAKHPMENYRGLTPDEIPHWGERYLYWWYFEWCSWISLFALKPNDRQVQAGLRFGLNVLDLWWKFSIWAYLLIYGGVFGQCIVQEPVNASEKHQSPWKLGTHFKCFWLCFFLFFVFIPSSWSSCHPTCSVFWSCCCL